MSLRNLIVKYVSDNQGIKGVDLALKVMSEVHPHEFKVQDFSEEIEKLVAEHEIMEVTYVLPTMQYRVKSIFFPKGTSVFVENQIRHHAETDGV